MTRESPLAMFGVYAADMLSGVGVPWFLGPTRCSDYGRDLMARGPKIIAWWHETFGVMENLVSVENVKAIALLKWGASVGEAKVHGGVEFVPFRFAAAIQGMSEPA
jgi:hypothetical protein